jgi:lysophospholipase L1-like esterase
MKKKPNLEQGNRLLFQGDSITDMKWGRNQSDRNHYLGHSFVFLIAARLHADFESLQLDFFNRGVSGNTTRDLKKRWQNDAIEMKPDILTLLIGTNDVAQNILASEFESNYRHIVDASLTSNPKLKLILMNPFVLQSGKLKDETAWKSRRSSTEELCLIVEKIAKDYKATHIELNLIFDRASEKTGPEHWLWDGVHPLPQGHEIIARSWIEALTDE